MSLRVFNQRRVTNYEDPISVTYLKTGPDDYSANSILCYPEPVRHRRRGDPRCPNDGHGINSLVTEANTVDTAMCDWGSYAHFYTEILEGLLRISGQRLGERWQQLLTWQCSPAISSSAAPRRA